MPPASLNRAAAASAARFRVRVTVGRRALVYPPVAAVRVDHAHRFLHQPAGTRGQGRIDHSGRPFRPHPLRGSPRAAEHEGGGGRHRRRQVHHGVVTAERGAQRAPVEHRDHDRRAALPAHRGSLLRGPRQSRNLMAGSDQRRESVTSIAPVPPSRNTRMPPTVALTHHGTDGQPAPEVPSCRQLKDRHAVRIARFRWSDCTGCATALATPLRS